MAKDKSPKERLRRFIEKIPDEKLEVFKSQVDSQYYKTSDFRLDMQGVEPHHSPSPCDMLTVSLIQLVEIQQTLPL